MTVRPGFLYLGFMLEPKQFTPYFSVTRPPELSVTFSPLGTPITSCFSPNMSKCAAAAWTPNFMWLYCDWFSAALLNHDWLFSYLSKHGKIKSIEIVSSMSHFYWTVIMIYSICHYCFITQPHIILTTFIFKYAR